MYAKNEEWAKLSHVISFFLFSFQIKFRRVYRLTINLFQINIPKNISDKTISFWVI